MPAKNTRNVVLTEHHADFINQQVASGRYQNASEVMRDGLRALEDRTEREAAEIDEIRARVGRSLDQLDRGEVADGDADAVVERAFETARRREGV